MILKRFLHGLIFGAGFAVAFVAISAAALWLAFPVMIGSDTILTSEPKEVRSPPEITRASRYLGSSGHYTGDLWRDSNRVLSGGPGRIVGAATVDGKPVVGLRLRLALNGSVMSQWVTTEAAGQYEVGVPYGEYRIDGFELDTTTANSVLAGKIEHPQSPYHSGTFEVADGAPGQGLNLEFVDPVVLEIPNNRFSADEEIVVRWQLYQGAQEYQVQIHERASARGYSKREPVFPWRARPIVNEPVMNLADYDVVLKAGRYYTVDIEARAGDGQPISRTGRRFGVFDFEIVE